jgi:hypothetical protein
VARDRHHLLHYSSGFGIPQAFFFTVQAGLSVGYGAEGVTCYDADDVDACNTFTSLQVLLTSALISSALSVYIDSLICNSFNEWEEVKREVVQRFRGNSNSESHQKWAGSHRHRSLIRSLSSMDNPSYPTPESLKDLRAMELFSKPWKTLVRASRVPYIQMA